MTGPVLLVCKNLCASVRAKLRIADRKYTENGN
ncbi:MAG: hypothetical protein Pg6C_13370 [Treponemataceae bacterium]|nr:MAG: hypothetical protein Pg6C_13370 [Treponemataceae bacterium]